MLENIKLLLNIADDKHDNMILLYISKVSTMVVDYCNVNELCLGLQSFIEDKVVSTSNGASLTSSDKEFLKQYRRARCY